MLQQNKYSNDFVKDQISFDFTFNAINSYVGNELVTQQIINSILNNDYFSEDVTLKRWAIGFKHSIDLFYFEGHFSESKYNKYSPKFLYWHLIAGYEISNKSFIYVEHGYNKHIGKVERYASNTGNAVMDTLANQSVNYLLDEAFCFDMQVNAIGFRYAFKPGTDIKLEIRRFDPRNSHITANIFNTGNDIGANTDLVTVVVNSVF